MSPLENYEEDDCGRRWRVHDVRFDLGKMETKKVEVIFRLKLFIDNCLILIQVKNGNYVIIFKLIMLII